MQGLGQSLNGGVVLVALFADQHVHIGGVGGFQSQSVLNGVQASTQRIVGVDNGEIHLAGDAGDGGGFHLGEGQVLGILHDVLGGRGEIGVVSQLDETLSFQQQEGTAFVGGVIGDGHGCAVRQIVQRVGLAGVDADVTANRITTLPRFTDATRWISIENIPVFSGKISILHQSAGSSTFANKSGKELIWRAMFPGNVAMISGMDAKHTNDELGNSFSYLDIVCKPGETKTAEACKYKLEEDEKFD